MARNEVQIKFTADLKEIDAQIRKLKASIMNPLTSTAFKQMAQVGLRDAMERRLDVGGDRDYYEAGKIRADSRQRTRKRIMGGIQSAGMVMGSAAAIGIALATRMDAVTERRNAWSTATMTNINQANAGLLTGADYAKNQMEANRKNLTTMYGNLPILSGYIQRKMDLDEGYQKFGVELQRQQNIQSHAASATMSAWEGARAMGFKLSDKEMERIANINLQIAGERQEASQKVNDIMQNTPESKRLYRMVDEYEYKYGNVREQIKEAAKEWGQNILQVYVDKIIPVLRGIGLGGY